MATASVAHEPTTLDLIGDEWTDFTDAFATEPLTEAELGMKRPTGSRSGNTLNGS